MTATPSPLSAPAEHDLDLEALREKYRYERDRRVRPDGGDQYQVPEGRFGYYVEDPYTPRVEREPLTDRVEVAILGTGFGGLVTGARLREAGVASIRLMDEAGDVGGTWYWNRYPGIHCDVASFAYMPLLDELGYVPRWKYAPGEEIRQHAIAIARRYDLYRDALFHTKVTELRWDDDAEEWLVSTDRGDGFRARFVVTASGVLSQAKLPRIPGIEDFRGHTFHTSRWHYEYTGGGPDGGLTGLADKRVAVIGTGATGIQVVPHLARDSQHLYVFQRTPSSVYVRGQEPIDPDWAATREPGWARRRRDNFLELLHDRPAEDLIQDGWTEFRALTATLQPATPYPDQSSREERARQLEVLDFLAMDKLRARVDEVVTDPATAEKLKPWYRYWCKRPGFSDEYLQAFNRPNVTLVDTAEYGGVQRITETSLVVGDQEYEVDCLVLATGFGVGQSGIVSSKLPVYGRGGEHLFEAWARHLGPRTLHGFYSNGFPNLFNLGTLQNTRTVNLAHILEEQATHVAAVIARAVEVPGAVVEPSAEDEAAWVATLAETSVDVNGFVAECTPGWYNNEGAGVNPYGEPFGHGPVVFFRMLREWREKHLDDVLQLPDRARPRTPMHSLEDA